MTAPLAGVAARLAREVDEAQLNRQLAHAVARVPEEALARPCHIGAGAPVTLDFVVRDYPRHLQHHLRQIPDSVSAEGTLQ